MSNKIIYWATRLIPAIIMLQTLFFKFSAAPESVYIFSTLHAEPYGRIGTGIMELLASVLILTPRTTIYGAVLAIGLMSGAILSHLFFLGISVQGDGGSLFAMAVITLLSSAFVVWQEKDFLVKRLSFVF
jgi:DoxX-like family